jgi:hypothetical protein
LRDVNTICRRSWYIAAHVWKIYDFKIEVVPLIITTEKNVNLDDHNQMFTAVQENSHITLHVMWLMIRTPA